MRNLFLCFAALFIGWNSDAWATGDAEKDPFAWQWYEADAEGNLRMNLYVFWRSTCPHCPAALEYAKQLRQRHPWLRVRTYEISQHAGNLELYRRMVRSLERPAGQVPAFFFCRQMVLSHHSEADGGRRIEGPLVQCYQYLHQQWKQQRPSAHAAEAAHPDKPVTSWQAGRVLAQVFSEGAADKLPQQPGAVGPPSGELEQTDAWALPDLELPPPPADAEEIVELPFVGATNAQSYRFPC